MVPETDPDERVPSVVQRHLQSRFRKPIQHHNQVAFDWLRGVVGEAPHLVIDAGCGTGASTERVAERHPDGWVVGVDKSASRLARGVGFASAEPGVIRGRCAWIRSDLVDFWRLSSAAGWRFAHHYLLYPNPWPKSAHLARRWHGHPVFPTLVGLSLHLTLRTNWRTYAVEFGHALSVMGHSYVLRDQAADGLTPFEVKYGASGHTLTELRLLHSVRDR